MKHILQHKTSQEIETSGIYSMKNEALELLVREKQLCGENGS
jgi:hypothetical protein